MSKGASLVIGVDYIGSGRKRCLVFRVIARRTLKRALHRVRHQRRETYKRHWTAALKAVWPVDQ